MVALPAAAEPLAHAEGVLIESHVDRRGGDAETLVQPIRDELAKRSFAVGSALARRVEADVSRSSEGLTEERAAEAVRFIDSGFEQFHSGAFKSALRESTHGTSLLLAAPASMARDQKLRMKLLRGLVGQSVSAKRMGENDKAVRAMSEIIRSFPDQEPSRAKYGPEVRDFLLKVKQSMKAQGSGRLEIKVDHKGAMVFVNERYVGVGSVSLSNLYPGRYRVYIQQGDREGRVHEVAVNAGQTSKLEIEWLFDAALKSAGDTVGLQFAAEREREANEGPFSVQLARSLRADAVAVVGIRTHKGQRSLIGTVYSLDSGKPLRSAAIALEPAAPSETSLRALARYLAGDKSALKLLKPIFVGGSRENSRVRLEGRRADVWYQDWLGWATAGVGAAALGVGVGFLASASSLNSKADSEPDQMEVMRLRDRAGTRRTLGLVLTITGSAALTIGIVKLARNPTSKRSRGTNIAISFSPRGFALTGRF